MCGDFGFLWDGGAAEERVLKKLGKKKYAIAFVDGAHENFDLLNRCPEGEWNGGRVHLLGGQIYHLMRGEVYTIEGKTVFAFGGAETKERQLYQDVGRWWREEFPTMAEMKNGALHLQEHGRKVDYIVTHWPAPRMAGNRGERNALDAYFDTIARQVEYKRWYFGYLPQRPQAHREKLLDVSGDPARRVTGKRQKEKRKPAVRPVFVFWGGVVLKKRDRPLSQNI